MKTRRTHSVFTSVILCTTLLGGCAQEQAPPKPQEFTRDTTCALDGMLLADYPGPKGQIRYADGTSEYFCDPMEMISILLRPEQSRQVAAAYTQDMGQTDWKAPRGHWIEAKQAVYVSGSNLHGAMGPTLAAFARPSDAEAFAHRHGGRVLRFEQILPATVSLDGGVIDDERSH